MYVVLLTIALAIKVITWLGQACSEGNKGTSLDMFGRYSSSMFICCNISLQKSYLYIYIQININSNSNTNNKGNKIIN